MAELCYFFKSLTMLYEPARKKYQVRKSSTFMFVQILICDCQVLRLYPFSVFFVWWKLAFFWRILYQILKIHVYLCHLKGTFLRLKTCIFKKGQETFLNKLKTWFNGLHDDFIIKRLKRKMFSHLMW
jgi:hypothetical protein